ncbi:MAG TPA: GntR family transcriptional regulator [Solirubrobacteraceae bacterium]|nr:GntR family transcriptional regulator [Solirubrobacteraceae bacterium]
MEFERTQLPRTSEAIAASALRAAIIRGDLRPGAKIRQEATAAQLGVSLIPLREALKTLAGEGAVTYEPQRGYFVTELHDGAIRQIYELRAVVEAEAERRALPNLLEPDRAAMRFAIHTQERAAQDLDAVEMIAANRRFHFALFDRCGNPWLLRFVTQLWDALDPYRVLSYRRMWLDADDRVIPEAIVGEHTAILAAIDNEDPALALELLERHRERSETFIETLVAPPAP